MNDEKDLKVLVEEYLDMWDGTVIAEQIRQMLKRGCSYSDICNTFNVKTFVKRK